MHKKIIIVLFLAALAVKAGSAHESVPAGKSAVPAAHSFEALEREVLENNPELRVYEAEVRAARGLRRTAGLWNNPELSSTIAHKNIDSDGASRSGAAFEVTLAQTFEWPGRMSLRKAIAERDIERAELELEQFRAFLKMRVKTAAYAFSAAQAKAEAAREVASQFQALRRTLAERDQNALVPLLETRVIEAIEINMMRRTSQAALEATQTLFNLNQLRGAPAETPLDLGILEPVFMPVQMEKEKIMASAVQHDYEVQLRALELRRQGYDVRLAQNERFPGITAGPAFSIERAGEEERLIGAVVSLPLPVWDRNQGAIETARAREDQAGAFFELTRQDAARRAAQAIATYEIKLNEMRNWQPDSIRHFKEAAELADRHYRLGAVPVSTYLELQTQYLDTLEGLLDTRQEALQSAAELEAMTADSVQLVSMEKGGER